MTKLIWVPHIKFSGQSKLETDRGGTTTICQNKPSTEKQWTLLAVVQFLLPPQIQSLVVSLLPVLTSAQPLLHLNFIFRSLLKTVFLIKIANGLTHDSFLIYTAIYHKIQHLNVEFYWWHIYKICCSLSSSNKIKAQSSSFVFDWLDKN